MLKHLTALAHCGAGAGEPRVLHGAFPESLDLPALALGLEGKPSLKKLDEQLLVLVPVAGSGWCAWLFDRMPPVTELPGLIDRIRMLSEGLLAASGPAAASPASATPDTPPLAATLLKDVSGTGRPSRAGALQILADAGVVHDLGAGLIAMACGATRCGKAAASRQDWLSHVDECRRLVKLHRGETTAIRTFRAQSQEDGDLEGAMLCETLGARSLTLLAPPLGQPGVALMLIDPKPARESDLTTLADLGSVMLGLRHATAREQRGRKLAMRVSLAAVMAAVIFLGWPVARIVTAPALSEPAMARAVNLPFDSFLSTMDVEVGDTVAEGQPIARMSAPDLEAKRNQIEFQMSVQDISAKAALAQNDYGSYQLSMQKIETLKGELSQVTERLDRLEVKAPVAGTVIGTLGRDALGRFVPTGQEVALLQPDDRFAMSVTISRVDAPLIRPGQTGEVYFRGLGGETYPFTILTPVHVEPAREGSSERLVTLARIDRPGGGQLISGLSGFAQIEAGRTLRIANYTRYLREYLKVTAWTYLGLHF
ncbi:HlyD family efflux transporter periplasmic adaptor subunit [Roseibium aestuarii]|uniref:HlyD family efflux transporter periplasmic adaptor subunit n=1 Tax=Roseibium aestuarii TaxID=2600299 RepID=A0ABW4JTI6_9HYPH|nr:HlyD family efflux transporter periplasmic adaptor subunit [Roseibium aestuarii]